jgi:hypothetical protein
MSVVTVDGMTCRDCGSDLVYVEHYDDALGGIPGGAYERVRLRCTACEIPWTLTLTMRAGWDRPAVTTPRKPLLAAG